MHVFENVISLLNSDACPQRTSVEKLYTEVGLSFGDNLFDWISKCESHSDLHKTLPTCLFSWWHHYNHCSTPRVMMVTPLLGRTFHTPQLSQQSQLSTQGRRIYIATLYNHNNTPLETNDHASYKLYDIYIPCPCYCPPPTQLLVTCDLLPGTTDHPWRGGSGDTRLLLVLGVPATIHPQLL